MTSRGAARGRFVPEPGIEDFAASAAGAPHAVFLIGAPIALLAFALTWLLKDLPLRSHAYIAADDTMPRGNAPDTPQGTAKL